MSNYSPSPWSVSTQEEEPHLCVDDANGHIIANVYGGMRFPTGRFCHVNAHIISAAPELLEACKNAIAYMERTSSNSDLYHAEMIEPLRNAISRAEGKSK